MSGERGIFGRDVNACLKFVCFFFEDLEGELGVEPPCGCCCRKPLEEAVRGRSSTVTFSAESRPRLEMAGEDVDFISSRRGVVGRVNGPSSKWWRSFFPLPLTPCDLLENGV